LVLEEKQTELNQTIFRIYNNWTEPNCLSLKMNRTVKVELNRTVFKIYNNWTKLNWLSLKPNRTFKVVRFYGFCWTISQVYECVAQVIKELSNHRDWIFQGKQLTKLKAKCKRHLGFSHQQVI
jgi:hypothetical protein